MDRFQVSTKTLIKKEKYEIHSKYDRCLDCSYFIQLYSLFVMESSALDIDEVMVLEACPALKSNHIVLSCLDMFIASMACFYIFVAFFFLDWSG